MYTVVHYKPIEGMGVDGRPIHKSIKVIEDVDYNIAEIICEETAKKLQKKVFVVKDKTQILMKDYTRKDNI